MRVVMLLLIFVFSIIGVLLPFWLDRRNDILNSGLFDLMQCFAVGVVCGVAILHIFADAQEDLSDVSDFPVAGSVMLLGCFAMVSLNRIVTLVAARHTSSREARDLALNHHSEELGATDAYPHARSLNVSESLNDPRALDAHSSTGCHERQTSPNSSGSFHGHVHQRLLLDPAAMSTTGIRIKAYLLEAAIAVHSVLVGLGIGIIDEDSSEANTIKVITLGLALCFHQFFEGVAVGNQGVRVGMKGQACIVMIVLFSLSCPLGGCLGMLLEACFSTKSHEKHWILGSLNAFAAGTLLEIGCVDLLPELFSHKHGHSEKISLRVEAWRLCALVSGSGVMAVLAIWA